MRPRLLCYPEVVVAALIVGGMTAWYLGVRSGVAAAAVTAVALLVAAVVPGLTLTVYALVIAWVAAMYFFGPKIASQVGASPGVVSRLSGLARALQWRRPPNRPNTRTR